MSQDKLRDRLTRTIEQADRMVHIIQHVRMFAREAGKPDLSIIQVNDVVHSSVDLLGAQFRSHGLELVCELTPDLPPVLANAFSLEEVVLNLLNNAKHAVESRSDPADSPSQVIIRTALNETDANLRVKIEIVDYGVGIRPEVLGKVFDPFFTTKDPDEGTGLGLSVSKTIVEELNGDLLIRSTPGEGTTVTVLLPPEKPDTQEARPA